MTFSCMHLRMEISLDGDSKAHVNEGSIIDEQANQPPRETNEGFYDAHEENEQKTTVGIKVF